jgi:hypothetical protein
MSETSELFFECELRPRIDPSQLYQRRSDLFKEIEDVEKQLDGLDNPCVCGKPSTVWLRTVNYPQDQIFTRKQGGEWVIKDELGGGDREFVYGIYFCEKCYRTWSGIDDTN